MGNFLNIHHWHIPTYKLSTGKTPMAMIFTPGRQIKFLKLPANQKFFIHKEFGLFEIKENMVFFSDSGTPIYFFDTRNQNPINFPLMDKLYRWAYQNKLSVITRQNIKDGINLRVFKKDDIESTRKEKIKIIEKSITKIKKDALIKNEQRKQPTPEDIEGLDAEEKIITEKDITFDIIKLLLKDKLIDIEKALEYEYRLALGDLKSDDVIEELKNFEKVTVNIPLDHKLDMVLPEYHTYNPKDILGIIALGTKIDKGLKNLRVKPLRGGINPMIILFGALGVLITLILLSNGSIDINNMLGVSYENP